MMYIILLLLISVMKYVGFKVSSPCFFPILFIGDPKFPGILTHLSNEP